MRGRTCGNELRLQNKCGELCNCCHKREKPAAAAIYKRVKLCNCCHAQKKTCGGYNTSMVNYRTAAMRVKACGGCNLRLQYICGKLCNCCYKGENLRWLQYTGAGNYATAVMRGKTCGGYNTSVVNYATAAMHGKACGGCSTSAGNYATGAMRGKNCDGCKRGSTQLMLSAGIHANCRCKHTVYFRSGKRTLALTCSLRTVWTLEGVSRTF